MYKCPVCSKESPKAYFGHVGDLTDFSLTLLDERGNAIFPQTGLKVKALVCKYCGNVQLMTANFISQPDIE